MNGKIKATLDFLNPRNAKGGRLLGRIIGPVLVSAVMASQVVPGTPLNLLGLTEIGGGVTQPGAELVLGVDLSYAETTVGWWQDRRADGVRIGAQALLAVPYSGPEVPTPACDNIRNMMAADVRPVGYIVVSQWLPGAASIDAGYRACSDLWPHLLFVAIDVETAQANPVADILAAIQRVRELGQAPVIYTSWGMWSRYVGAWVPEGVVLWNAYWDGDPDVDYSRLPFGFTVLVGEQYDNDRNWNGITVDMNVFHAGLLYQPPAPPTSAPPDPPGSPPAPIQSHSLPLIKLANDPAVYVVVGGVRFSVCDPITFVAQGFKWEDIQVVTEDSTLWRLAGVDFCRR